MNRLYNVVGALDRAFANNRLFYPLLVALVVVLLALSACATPLVQRATFDGHGEVRFDGDHLAAVGAFEGELSTFWKGGAPGPAVPISVRAGYVVLAKLSTGEFLVLELGSPLPPWVRVLLISPDEQWPPISLFYQRRLDALGCSSPPVFAVVSRAEGQHGPGAPDNPSRDREEDVPVPLLLPKVT